LAREEKVERTVKQDGEARVREGAKAVLEAVLKVETTAYLKGVHRELATRRCECNGRYTRDLLALAGKTSTCRCPEIWKKSSSPSLPTYYPLGCPTNRFRR
jgi:hypothetical protein